MTIKKCYTKKMGFGIYQSFVLMSDIPSSSSFCTQVVPNQGKEPPTLISGFWKIFP